MPKRSFRPDSVQIGRSQPTISTVSEASELGPMVQGQFVVRNAGPSLVPTLELQISWPSMSDSDDRFIIYPSTISVDSDDVSSVTIRCFIKLGTSVTGVCLVS